MRSSRGGLTICLRVTLEALLLLTGLLATPVWAADEASRPRIALVLSGGGARGVAHVGVLQVLEEMRIPVDVIVGTSMGAIVAGAYAGGLSPAEMAQRIREARWDRVLADLPERADRSIRSKEAERRGISALELGIGEGAFRLPKGALYGQQLEVFLATLAPAQSHAGSFDQLGIPFRAVATDIENGQMVVLDRGDLIQALRASMSVPGVFAPKEIDGRMLVDGGLVRNLPVDVARALGAQVIIAVNLGSPLLGRGEISSVVDISTQMLHILTEQNVRSSLAELRDGDVLILPELGSYSAGNFADSASIIPIGAAAARKQAGPLARLSLSQDEYARHRLARGERARPPGRLDRVRVESAALRWVNPEAVEQLITIRPGDMPEAAQLQADLQALLATGDFQQVRHRFVQEDGQEVLVIEPVEKDWGPTYVQFGLNLSTDLEGESSFDVLLDHRMTWLTGRGLEWRNEMSLGRTTAWHTELHQPLTRARDLFVTLYGDLRQTQDNIFVDDTPIVAYDTRRGLIGTDLGLKFGRVAVLRLGYRTGRVSSSPDVALPFFVTVRQEIGEFAARLIYDRLDHWAFPSAGLYGNAELLSSRRWSGADSDYRSLRGDLDLAFSRGARRVVLGLRAGTNLGSTLPLFNQFSLGGFLNLSGMQNRQLLGPRFALARVVYYERFGSRSLFSLPIYLGGSLEAGNVYARFNGTQSPGPIAAGSVFLALESPAGPLYLAAGLAEGGRAAFYLFLGRP